MLTGERQCNKGIKTGSSYSTCVQVSLTVVCLFPGVGDQGQAARYHRYAGREAETTAWGKYRPHSLQLLASLRK